MAQVSVIGEDGLLDWRPVTFVAPAIAARGVPAVRRDELPSPAFGALMTGFCTLGIIFTAQWSLLVIALLAVLVIVDGKARGENVIVGRCALAAVSAAGCWMMIRGWDFLDEDLKIGQATMVSGAFALGLWAVGDALRRAARLQKQTKDSLFVGLYALGAGAQLLSAVIVSVAVGGVLVASLDRLLAV